MEDKFKEYEKLINYVNDIKKDINYSKDKINNINLKIDYDNKYIKILINSFIEEQKFNKAYEKIEKEKEKDEYWKIDPWIL